MLGVNELEVRWVQTERESDTQGRTHLPSDTSFTSYFYPTRVPALYLDASRPVRDGVLRTRPHPEFRS